MNGIRTLLARMKRGWVEGTVNLFGPKTRRIWLATLVGVAIFTAVFWGVVAAEFAQVSLNEGDGRDMARHALGIYFFVVLFGAPVFAHSAGAMLDDYTAEWDRDDAVVAFAGLGLVAGAVTTLAMIPGIPDGNGPSSAIWLFGVPTFLATMLTRFFIDAFERSLRLTRLAFAVALTPVAVTLWLMLGLYVAEGSHPAS